MDTDSAAEMLTLKLACLAHIIKKKKKYYFIITLNKPVTFLKYIIVDVNLEYDELLSKPTGSHSIWVSRSAYMWLNIAMYSDYFVNKQTNKNLKTFWTDLN